MNEQSPDFGYTLDSPKCGNCIFFSSKIIEHQTYSRGSGGGMYPSGTTKRHKDQFCLKHGFETRKTAYCEGYERNEQQN